MTGSFKETSHANKRSRPQSMNGTHVQPKAKRSLVWADEQQKKSSHHDVTDFEAVLHINKDYCCNVRFTLTNSAKLPKSVQRIIEEDNVTLRVVDFCPKSCLLLYRDYDNGVDFDVLDGDSDFSLNKSLPYMRIEPTEDNDKTILAFMKGLLTRNSEMAVIALPDTDYQILMFFRDSEVSVDDEASYDIDVLVNMTPFSTTFRAVLVNRYNLVLDLDYTLIRTRVPKNSAEKPSSKHIKEGDYDIKEYEFMIDDQRYICMVRPGTDLLLGWAAKLFKLYVITNAIYPVSKFSNFH
jgi:hypothetical protein